MPLPRTPHLLTTIATVAAGLLVAVSGNAASANAAALVNAHNPVAALTSVVWHGRTVQFTGWAFDPDAPTRNAAISLVVDGRIRQTTTTDMATTVPHSALTRTGVASVGKTPGFTVTMTVPSATHTVCLSVRNTAGIGDATVLRCVVSPRHSLSSSEKQAHSPYGRFSAHLRGATLTVSGAAADPDMVARPETVVFYLDGHPVSTKQTVRATSSTPPLDGRLLGQLSSYSFSTSVDAGAHIGCVLAVNVGIGSNSLLGCQAVDTRGGHTTGVTHHPQVNKKVVTAAKKEIGHKYVWGAEGPQHFDCSGLVQYTYAKAGLSTPRVAQDQFHAAHLIPAARAVPGDLVFYHDSKGAVYHVGIVTGPGNSIAAIDPQEGVNWQPTTWDPTATFGSFTHR